MGTIIKPKYATLKQRTGLVKRITKWIEDNRSGNDTQAERTWKMVAENINLTLEQYKQLWEVYADESKLTTGQLRKKWGNLYGMPLDRNGFPDIGFQPMSLATLAFRQEFTNPTKYTAYYLFDPDNDKFIQFVTDGTPPDDRSHVMGMEIKKFDSELYVHYQQLTALYKDSHNPHWVHQITPETFMKALLT